MDSQARVQSLTSIESVRTALVSFVDQVDDALTELEAQMRRVLDWLEHDRPRYWKTQVRLSIDQVQEAQQALHRCLMFPVGGERPSCYEERAALKQAQARQAYCEQKSERVRHWQQVVRHELFEYEGRISQMVRLVEIDVPQAIGMLTRILRHLEEYQAVRVTDPQTAYNDLAIARELWPDGEVKKAADGEAAAATGTEREAASDREDASVEQDANARTKEVEQGED